VITRRVVIARCRETLKALHTLCFPADDQPSWRDDGEAWIVYDDGEPVAFLYAEPSHGTVWYFSRVGVMPAARGKGLQRKLMRTMCRRLKALGATACISTTYENPASANNFVREQWKTYLPEWRWGAAGTIYWIKNL
jgi:GNAT superfamily N-acetyltransferase